MIAGRKSLRDSIDVCLHVSFTLGLPSIDNVYTCDVSLHTRALTLWTHALKLMPSSDEASMTNNKTINLKNQNIKNNPLSSIPSRIHGVTIHHGRASVLP